MRSRRVILNDSPNSNTRAGTYRGKTAPVPMHDSHSWRNPGGPIGSPAGNKATSYAVAKPDHAGKHTGTYGRPGRNIRRQQPYAGNKYSAKAAAKRQHSQQGTVRNASLQRANVHSPAQQESAQYPRQSKPNKAQKNAGGNVLRVPLRRGRRPALGQWDVDGEVHKLPVMVALRDELYMQMRSLHSRYDCVRKVMIRNPDLQKLPEKQAKGAIQKLWCNWTFSDMKSSKEAHKAISRENARRMICLLYTSPSPRDS